MQASNKTFAQNCTPALPIKKRTEKRNPTRDRRRARTLSRTYERQNHARTNVRREHHARTHVRTSEESTERTVHIQQWGSHPLSLAGRARPRKTICKLKRFVNDLERTTDFLCLWYALIVAQSRIAPAEQQLSELLHAVQRSRSSTEAFGMRVPSV